MGGWTGCGKAPIGNGVVNGSFAEGFGQTFSPDRIIEAISSQLEQACSHVVAMLEMIQ
jgi:uncharacterized protein YjcR